MDANPRRCYGPRFIRPRVTTTKSKLPNLSCLSLDLLLRCFGFGRRRRSEFMRWLGRRRCCRCFSRNNLLLRRLIRLGQLGRRRSGCSCCNIGGCRWVAGRRHAASFHRREILHPVSFAPSLLDSAHGRGRFGGLGAVSFSGAWHRRLDNDGRMFRWFDRGRVQLRRHDNGRDLLRQLDTRGVLLRWPFLVGILNRGIECVGLLRQRISRADPRCRC